MKILCRAVFVLFYLCAGYSLAEAQTVNLTITTEGSVSGAVGVIGPGGNVCNPNPGGGPGGGTCVFSYPVGTFLRVSADAPNTPGFFVEGTGDAAGCATSTCRFTINQDSFIKATFGVVSGPYASVTIGLGGDGKGEVGSDNNNCQNWELGFSACTVYYAPGSLVTLEGRGVPGNIFAGFSGAAGDASGCGSSSPCVFTLNASASINAAFSPLTSVAVTPSAPTIGVGNSQFFSATGTFANATTRLLFGGLGRWSTRSPMYVARFSLAAVGLNNRVYAIGGVDGSCPSGPCAFHPLDTVERYDPAHSSFGTNDFWDPPPTSGHSPMAPMLTPREGLALVVANGQIYALGGHTLGGGPVSSLEVYDPIGNSWTALASMPTARAGLSAAVIGNVIYAVGGDGAASGDPAMPLNTLEAYDIATNTWATKTPMLYTRRGLAAAAVNGKLYAIAGDPNSGVVEEYDPAANTWTTKASMPNGRAAVAAGAIDGVIYVIASASGSANSSVDAYNPALNLWTAMGSMPTPRGEFGLAVLDGRLFAVGGSDAGNLATPTLQVFRPAEVIWSSSNPAVGAITLNDSNVSGLSAGTTTIRARSVGIASGAQSATLTVGTGGGGGGGPIFVNTPNSATTQVGNASWGCGSFSFVSGTGTSASATVNYGDGSGVQSLPLSIPGSGPCAGSGGGGGPTGTFAFNHAYSATGTYTVSVVVTNTTTSATKSASFPVTVNTGGGGGGGPIFVNTPGSANTQVGNASWGCGSFFFVSGTGSSASATVDYGDGSGVQSLPLSIPGSGPCASGGGGTPTGTFAFNHAYSATGTYTVSVIVTNTTTSATKSASFPINVDNGGGGGDDGCVPVSTNFTAGSVPFTTVHLALFDRPSGELLFETDVPLGATDLGQAPAGLFRVELTVPAGYTITPDQIEFDAVCGEPIVLTASIAPVDSTSPSITVTVPAENAVFVTGSTVLADYACTDTGSGVATCVGSVPDGVAIDTSTTGLHTFTVHATDNAGNPADVSVPYTVQPASTARPIITGGPPKHFTLEATGPDGAVYDYALPTATDGNGVPVPIVCTPASGSTLPLGRTHGVCTATDGSGRTSRLRFNVLVDDTTAPVFAAAPPDLTAAATSPQGVVVTYALPLATDIVDASVSVACSPISGHQFHIGTTTVTCTAKDDSHNKATTTFTVTVSDHQAPVFSSAPADLIVEATRPEGARVVYAKPVATDEADLHVAVACAPASGTIFPAGTTLVTCTGTDNSGNTATVSFNVTVQDTTAPTIRISRPDAAVYNQGQRVIANYSCRDDGLGVASCVGTTADGAAIDTSTLGTHTFTVTATDVAGNAAITQSITYTVRPRP